ncbi:unnamed protein product, partial [Hapterophycus canaliculatus]
AILTVWRCTSPLARSRMGFPTTVASEAPTMWRDVTATSTLLLDHCCASPALAHSVSLEFKFRRNVRMIVKNLDLPLGGHYNQHDVELT